MPKHTLRANARTLSKNSDAELIAVTAECVAVNIARDKSGEALEAAEARMQRVPPPPSIVRTKEDLELGLFVGTSGVGRPYEEDDIRLIRPMVRRLGRDVREAAGSWKQFTRGGEILRDWSAWRSAVEIEEARSGLKTANEAQSSYDNKFDRLVGRLLAMPAASLDGLLAKAKAFAGNFPDDSTMGEKIGDAFTKFGPDEDVLARGLARDLVRLARAREA
jgi:hypothetical protein